MDTILPKALTLAAELRAGNWAPNVLQNETALRGRAADELQILHAENESLRTSCDNLRAGYDAARLEIASLQARVNECGAGAGCCAQAARIAELEAQLEAVGAGGVGPLGGNGALTNEGTMPAAQAQPVAWKMDKDTFQFLSDVMTAAGLVEHGKQCKALAERLCSGVMAVRKTFQAHWAPDPNQKIVKVDCGDYYQWQAAPAQAQEDAMDSAMEYEPDQPESMPLTQKEIIGMAREAGIEVHPRKDSIRIGSAILTGCDSTEEVTRFAALVAAKAAAAEREACVAACEKVRKRAKDTASGSFVTDAGKDIFNAMAAGAHNCMVAIAAQQGDKT